MCLASHDKNMGTARIGLNTAAKSPTSESPKTSIKLTAKSAAA